MILTPLTQLMTRVGIPSDYGFKLKTNRCSTGKRKACGQWAAGSNFHTFLYQLQCVKAFHQSS